LRIDYICSGKNNKDKNCAKEERRKTKNSAINVRRVFEANFETVFSEKKR
jgi:hypothetical protein